MTKYPAANWGFMLPSAVAAHDVHVFVCLFQEIAQINVKQLNIG